MTHHEASGHPEHHGSAPCRVCTSSVDPDHPMSGLGLCHHCVYKILIVVFVVLIAISYMVWFGIF